MTINKEKRYTRNKRPEERNPSGFSLTYLLDMEGKKGTQDMKKRKAAGMLIVLDILILGVVRVCEMLADWYARRIYPLWTGIIGRILGLFPYSAVECLFYVLILFVILRTLYRVYKSVVKKESAVIHLKQAGENIVLGIAILFTLYTWMCGINYQRESFADIYQMQQKQYTAEELKEASKRLLADVNRYAKSVERDANGIMILGKGKRGAVLNDSGRNAVRAMQALGEECSELEGFYPIPKGLMVSEILSYQNLTGVYSPFTIEANYNADMPDYNIPFTMCHELSHLKGFMQEEEANFIAYLGCERSKEEAFRYSGALLGWLYCSNELYAYDKEAYRELEAKLCEEAVVDLNENNRFWDAYKGKIAKTAQKVNDAYLKANGQTEGVESYDRVTDLLVQHLLRKNR